MSGNWENEPITPLALTVKKSGKIQRFSYESRLFITMDQPWTGR
jgi:hypothetical protein